MTHNSNIEQYRLAVFELASFGGYRIEKSSLYSVCAANSPEDARQSKHQLALHGQFNVIVGNYRSFEALVIPCILECRNDSFGCAAVAYGIAARTLFAFRRRWPGTFQRVATVGFDLLKRAH